MLMSLMFVEETGPKACAPMGANKAMGINKVAIDLSFMMPHSL